MRKLIDREEFASTSGSYFVEDRIKRVMKTDNLGMYYDIRNELFSSLLCGDLRTYCIEVCRAANLRGLSVP